MASWVLQRGKCRYCAAPVSAFYPTVEFAAVAVVLWSSAVVSGWVFVASCVFGWTLLALAWADWRTLVLPNALTVFLVITGLGIAWWRMPLISHVIGALVGFASFWLLATLYKLIRKRDGLGFGDAKLMAGLGAWLSWIGLPTTIFYGGILGLLYVGGAALCGRKTSTLDRLPLGAFLALGGWLVWLYGLLNP